MSPTVRSNCRVMATAALILCAATPAVADWPMWRNNAARTASTEEVLSSDLVLHWTLQLPTPRPAWPPEQGKVRFDASYDPVVAGGRLFVPSMVSDSVTAYDIRDGKQIWRFYADGPVRFAPVVHRDVVHGDRVLAVADDGYLYCLSARSGSVLWKFRGGPTDRWLIGNDRMVSMWPARGAPVTYGDTVYFAAGIWPFMGVFVHAVDIATGDPLWTNSGTGSDYIVQQHNSPAFAGVAPQGYLAVNDQLVLVSGGMTVPAAFDRTTGQLLYFRPGDRQMGKDLGGYEVMIGPGWFCNRGGLHQLSDGDPRVKTVAALLGPDGAAGIAGEHLVGLGTSIRRHVKTTTDSRGKKKDTVTYSVAGQWRARLPKGATRLHLRADSEYLVSDSGSRILKIAQPQASESECRVQWEGRIAGTVWRMLVSDGRLFVVSEEGGIYCFGEPEASPAATPLVIHATTDARQPIVAAEAADTASELLEQTPKRAGYVVMESSQGLSIAKSLAQRSQFHIILLQSDSKLRQQWRQQLAQSQLLGSRVAILPATMADVQLAPYFAELVFVDGAGSSEAERLATLQRAFSILRPYGGTAILGATAGHRDAYAHAHQQAQLNGSTRSLAKRFVMSRPGPLAGAGTWTSQTGNTGNTLVSAEENVKTPLGLLWFGGPSNMDVLPRHGHGPTPQVVGGRLLIEGRDMLRAVDVYTGSLLWQRQLKNVGIFYDHTDHHPGAGAIGSNFATTADSIYVAWGRRCLRLDPATGKTLAEFHLPDGALGAKPFWGHLRVTDDYLIAGSTPMLLLTPGPGKEAPKKGEKREIPLFSQFGEGSRRLVVMDRFTGEVKWKRVAQFNFRHSAIAVGDGKLFCLDRMTEKRIAYFRRRGDVPVADSCLYALNLRTGDVLWQTNDDVFGTWLAYEPKSKLLLQAGSKNRDRAEDEVGRGMSVHSGDSGELRWRSDIEYGGPPLLYPDRIVTQGAAVDLFTGEPLQRRHPLTGEQLPWKFSRNYGCCTAIGCVNLLTFRSAAAGYFDLQHDGGTGNFGGFRTGCTANLIAADGVLNAPDYTRTCMCSYQNQTSVALVHMPDVEMWTFNSIPSSSEPVKQLGINFGAPGDRRDENGTLWIDYPSVGGPSPNVPITVDGQSVTYTRQHSSVVESREPKWVFASSLHGASSIQIRLAGTQGAGEVARPYRVKLYLAAPGKQTLANHPRVQLQAKAYDLWGPSAKVSDLNQGVVCEIEEVYVRDDLRIEFAEADARPAICGIEIRLK